METRPDVIVRKRRRLPSTLPVFPMPSALLLPGCRLPLNIFEPRYRQMVEDVLAGDRMIGMVQPLEPESDRSEPELQQIGCAGRVATVKQTEDGRYLIDLVGVSRFVIARELSTDRLYRVVEPDWSGFVADRRRRAPQVRIDREELEANLRAYFDARGLEANWEAIEASGNEELVNSLAMVCPFDASEKQALLEASDVSERSRLVNALMSMAVLYADEPLTLH